MPSSAPAAPRPPDGESRGGSVGIGLAKRLWAPVGPALTEAWHTAKTGATLTVNYSTKVLQDRPYTASGAVLSAAGVGLWCAQSCMNDPTRLQRLEKQQWANRQFTKLDVGGNGYIDMDQLKRGLRSQLGRIDKSRLEQLVGAAKLVAKRITVNDQPKLYIDKRTFMRLVASGELNEFERCARARSIAISIDVMQRQNPFLCSHCSVQHLHHLCLCRLVKITVVDEETTHDTLTFTIPDCIFQHSSRSPTNINFAADRPKIKHHQIGPTEKEGTLHLRVRFGKLVTKGLGELVTRAGIDVERDVQWDTHKRKEGETYREWLNPLRYREGAHFSPLWKHNKDHMPPTTVLSGESERRYIINKHGRNNENVVHGQLREFTLCGLTPSTVASSMTPILRGVGLDEVRVVEVQVLVVEDFESWDHAVKHEEEYSWTPSAKQHSRHGGLLGKLHVSSLVHIVPAADLAQVLMKKVTDALSWDIFPALQTTVLAQLSGKQKEQHMQTLEQFVQDSLLHLKEHIVLPICAENPTGLANMVLAKGLSSDSSSFTLTDHLIRWLVVQYTRGVSMVASADPAAQLSHWIGLVAEPIFETAVVRTDLTHHLDTENFVQWRNAHWGGEHLGPVLREAAAEDVRNRVLRVDIPADQIFAVHVTIRRWQDCTSDDAHNPRSRPSSMGRYGPDLRVAWQIVHQNYKDEGTTFDLGDLVDDELITAAWCAPVSCPSGTDDDDASELLLQRWHRGQMKTVTNPLPGTDGGDTAIFGLHFRRCNSSDDPIRARKPKLPPGAIVILKAEAWQPGSFHATDFTFVLQVMDSPASPSSASNARRGSDASESVSSEHSGAAALVPEIELPRLVQRPTIADAARAIVSNASELLPRLAGQQVIGSYRDWVANNHDPKTERARTEHTQHSRELERLLKEEQMFVENSLSNGEQRDHVLQQSLSSWDEKYADWGTGDLVKGVAIRVANDTLVEPAMAMLRDKVSRPVRWLCCSLTGCAIVVMAILLVWLLLWQTVRATAYLLPLPLSFAQTGDMDGATLALNGRLDELAQMVAEQQKAACTMQGDRT